MYFARHSMRERRHIRMPPARDSCNRYRVAARKCTPDSTSGNCGFKVIVV
jgi:hypothetical protein